MIEAPYYPVVYVRGYAGSQSEVEDTVSTPYMGFNLGSTKLRQAYTGEIDVHVFESPLVRLMKDYEYVDAYRDGMRLPAPGTKIPPKSVWIFRYYDIVSEDLGSGDRKEIEHHAAKLREFIERIREYVLEPGEDPKKFRVHLVAHSMGGLVCRAFLQNPDHAALSAEPGWKGKCVDKLFTFATPHGGIDFRKGLGWVAGLRDFLDKNNAGNFGSKRMREFLALDDDQPLNSLGGKFPTERVFSMIGTDAEDYGAAFGAARKAVGPLSDGLVMIKNAAVSGAPRAFTHRSHSGHYGIVNAESSYQNLVRFLFGNVRIDGTLEVEELRLPSKVQKALDDEKKIRASYHFEVVLRVRGRRWDLHRRLVDESSAIFRKFDEMLQPKPGRSPRHPRLFSAFLDKNQVVNKRSRTLGFSIDISLMVPEYEVDRAFWFDDHYDGGFLFRDKLNLEVTPPKNEQDSWRLKHGWDSRTPNRAVSFVDAEPPVPDGPLVFRIPVNSRANARPGMKATLRLECRPWS